MWANALLKLQHQPDSILIKLTDAHLFQIWIALLHLFGDAFQHAIQVDVFNIHHDTVRIGQCKLFIFQCNIGF
ncbi:hypothetical protein D3C79_1074320 [compost metagenome]